jgi:hypothetical protein
MVNHMAQQQNSVTLQGLLAEALATKALMGSQASAIESFIDLQKQTTGASSEAENSSAIGGFNERDGLNAESTKSIASDRAYPRYPSEQSDAEKELERLRRVERQKERVIAVNGGPSNWEGTSAAAEELKQLRLAEKQKERVMALNGSPGGRGQRSLAARMIFALGVTAVVATAVHGNKGSEIPANDLPNAIIVTQVVAHSAVAPNETASRMVERVRQEVQSKLEAGVTQKMAVGAAGVSSANIVGTAAAHQFSYNGAVHRINLTREQEILWTGLKESESDHQQFDKDTGAPKTSRTGAIGISQLEPKTAEEEAQRAGMPWDPVRFAYDKKYNEALGAQHFHWLYKKFQGNAIHIAMAYNVGEGVVESLLRGESVKTHGGIWVHPKHPGDVSGIPDETSGYVLRVKSNTKKLALREYKGLAVAMFETHEISRGSHVANEGAFVVYKNGNSWNRVSPDDASPEQVTAAVRGDAGAGQVGAGVIVIPERIGSALKGAREEQENSAPAPGPRHRR